jgi:hypothetical protein
VNSVRNFAGVTEVDDEKPSQSSRCSGPVSNALSLDFGVPRPDRPDGRVNQQCPLQKFHGI